jgi:hypothetical protein
LLLSSQAVNRASGVIAEVTHRIAGARMRSFVNPLTDYSPELELEAISLDEQESESRRGIFSEDQEMELAIGLLEAGDEKQLDRVLGALIGQAAREAGSSVSPPVTRAFAGVLKTVAGHALPLAETAPGEPTTSRVGARIGRGLASIAGPTLGLELEGLSREDAEFEAVRQFVRFAGKSVANAAGATPDNESPIDLAHRAAAEAAHIYAPGLTIARRRVRRRGG